MPYGIIKIDTVTFTDAGVDKSVTLSGLVQNPTFSGNVTVTGTLSGVTVTGTTANFTSGNFTNISGGTHTITSGVFAAGSAASPSITFTGDLNTGIYSPGADQVAISTGGSGRLFVDASGNVRITSGSAWATADGNLQLSFDTNEAYATTYYDNHSITFGAGTSYKNKIRVSATGADNAITFHVGATSPNERMRITGAGLVGIGTSTPQASLDITSGTLQAVRTNLSSITDTFHQYRGTPDGLGYEHARVFSGRDTSVHTYGSYLAFYTEGKASGTTDTSLERLRIDSSGTVNIKGAGTAGVTQAVSFNGSAPVDSLVLTSGGLVGVGTSSPAKALDVFGQIQARPIGNTLNNSAWFAIGSVTDVSDYGVGVGLVVENASQNRYALTLGTRFSSAGIEERVRVSAAGNVGINTTTVDEKLHVSGGNIKQQLAAATNGGLSVNNGTNDLIAIGTGGFAANGGSVTDGGIRAANSLVFATGSGTPERARIDSSGRLLVGTSSSSAEAKFIVEGGATGSGGGMNIQRSVTTASAGSTIGFINFTNSSNNVGATVIAEGDGTWSAGTSHPTRLVFSTTADGASSPTERMRINNTGTVTINGTVSASTGTHTIQDSGSSPNTLRLYNSTDSNNTGDRFLICDAAASVLRAEIRSNGGLANYSANNINLASDMRLKKDISPLTTTWSKVKKIEVVNFRYKDCNEGDPLLYGVIAQQVQQVVPELVVVTREAQKAQDAELDNEGNVIKEAVEATPDYYGIREQPMYWLAIKALQEAMERIETLEQRLNDAGIN